MRFCLSQFENETCLYLINVTLVNQGHIFMIVNQVLKFLLVFFSFGTCGSFVLIHVTIAGYIITS